MAELYLLDPEHLWMKVIDITAMLRYADNNCFLIIEGMNDDGGKYELSIFRV